jgi:hypothetical protein
MKNTKKTRIRWGRLGLVGLVILALLIFVFYQRHQRIEAQRQIEANREVVRAMELRSVTEIEARLRAIKEEYGIGKIEVSEISDRKYFEDSIFMGDSVTQSISLYDILPPSNVVAAVGRNTRTALEDVALLENLSPARIFLWYGMNDLENFADAPSFKASYEGLIAEIHKTLPDTEIVLLSILPATADAIRKQPKISNERMESFNQGMATLAEENDYIYMDITEVVTPELYEPDGIHVKRQFYTKLFNFIKKEFIEK